MKIGIDFDNTIVCYDGVFHQVALELGLIPADLAQSKTAVRDFLRSKNREEEWTKLQGYVYGARMELAFPFPGIDAFFTGCENQGAEIAIISHKTTHPYLGPRYDLHESARKWLLRQNFFSSRLSIYFELTLKDKLERIEKEKCDIFIDDLPELLNETAFPKKVRKILFDPTNFYPHNPKWQTVAHWNSMASALFSHQPASTIP